MIRPAARLRRATVLLALAGACGVLAASEVAGRTQALDRRVGPTVPVVVAKRDIDRGERLGRRALGRLLELREVPARFVPPDALGAAADAAGLRTAAALPAGGYLTAGHLEQGDAVAGEGSRLRAGERALELRVSGGGEIGGEPAAGARVDVLVTSEPRSGPGRTYLALENVELLASRPAAEAEEGGAGADGDGARGDTLATLRLSRRQAVFLTAAQNFAREVRLLTRAPGERRAGGRAVTSAADL